jgi:hypothetical protein|tara:strand:+ start:635 stop:832 length:198 start_codon:yes stop_codon:yes gene_type:complete
MLEFIFGGMIGIWAAQQFNLPSVQQSLLLWWSPPPIQPNAEESLAEEKDSCPAFTGEMNAHLPSV